MWTFNLRLIITWDKCAAFSSVVAEVQWAQAMLSNQYWSENITGVIMKAQEKDFNIIAILLP